MSEAWHHSHLSGDTQGVLAAAAVAARNVTSWLTPRQLFPDVPLDVPSLMASVVVFTFLVQFFFTVVSINLAVASSSSSLSSRTAITTTTTTTTTTTSATTTVFDSIRTQTVTPAPPPAWRSFLRAPSAQQRLWRRSPDSLPFPARHRHVFHALSPQSWDTPHHFGKARGSFDRPRVAPRSTMSPKTSVSVAAEERRTGPRLMPIGYEVDEVGLSSEAVDILDPLTLSSHRVSLVPKGAQPLETNAAGLMSGMLYGAERWGDRLLDWNILSADGAQALTQTLLMVRCAFISPGFCAKLDHYFRRQHDLHLVAAMMNHHGDYDRVADTGQPETPRSEKKPAPGKQAEVGDEEVKQASKVMTVVQRDRGDRGGTKSTKTKLEMQGKTGAVGLEDQRGPAKKPGGIPSVGHRRKVKFPGRVRPKGKPAERQDKRRVGTPVPSGLAPTSSKSWGVYMMVMVAAVVLLVMEAAQRIVQFVTNPGRALYRPHHDPMTTLTAALHRWHDPYAPLMEH
ncbi:hypothetical protein E2C01_004953 [Portunus trituberculatus]|uniref:Uncharacterized protein n=1 Tax=Portunus trituberculatus TaxID=210409 RepID=A0A5B7CTQ5_PORTR|nr:hypothetical protein [Portunus trituberculatus]